jgi:hypothetical protein
VDANVAAANVELFDADPHEMRAPDGVASVNDDASHFTQDETVNEEELVGRLDSKGADTYEPLETVRPSLGNKDMVEK